MGNLQSPAGFSKRENDLLLQMMIRDFKENERNAIDLILRFSRDCNSDYAEIPKKKDFSLVGIHPNYISDVLKELSDKKVIFNIEGSNQYAINPDYNQWAVPIKKGYDEKRFNQLLHMNLIKQNTVKRKINRVFRESIKDLESQQNTDSNFNKRMSDLSIKYGAMESRDTLVLLDSIVSKESNINKDIYYMYAITAYQVECPILQKIIELSSCLELPLDSFVKYFKDIKDVRKYFIKVARIPYLNGKGKDGWKANFDWLINVNNVRNVLSGKYGDGEKNEGFSGEGRAAKFGKINLKQWD